MDNISLKVVREPLIPSKWGLPKAFRQRLGEESGRQRAMVADGHLLLVLHHPPRPDDDARVGRVFWRDASGAWKPAALKHGDVAVGELLGEYEKALDEVDDAEEAAETAQEYFDIMTRIHPLVRAIHNAHNALQTARQELPEARELILLRDRAYALSRRAELTQADAKIALEYVIARRSEEQARDARRQTRSAFRLNVLAALFFPIVTVSTVLGMNLDNGLGQLDASHAPWPMLALLAGSFGLGALLTAIVTRD